MAASAVGMVARNAQGQPVSNEELRPQAREACSAHAAQYGAVHVIDGRTPHNVIAELFTDTGVGTVVRPDAAEPAP